MRNTMDLVKLVSVIVAMIFLAAIGIALGGCNPLPVTTTPDEAPDPIVYEVQTKAQAEIVRALPGEWIALPPFVRPLYFRLAPDQVFPGGELDLPEGWSAVRTEDALVRFRPAAPSSACLCPDFALTDHPEDPGEAPGTWCLAKSRTGVWMDAREHPACQREAQGQGGGQ